MTIDVGQPVKATALLPSQERLRKKTPLPPTTMTMLFHTIPLFLFNGIPC
ncbi:hypothetical protein [Undibacterium sp. Xuan67W]